MGSRTLFDSMLGWTWHDPDLGRPIAAPVERCAELLDVHLATICEAAANVEPTSAPTAPGSGA